MARQRENNSNVPIRNMHYITSYQKIAVVKMSDRVHKIQVLVKLIKVIISNSNVRVVSCLAVS